MILEKIRVGYHHDFKNRTELVGLTNSTEPNLNLVQLLLKIEN